MADDRKHKPDQSLEGSDESAIDQLIQVAERAAIEVGDLRRAGVPVCDAEYIIRALRNSQNN